MSRPDLSSFPSSQHQPRRSILSLRKLALMATVATGLGFGAFSLTPTFNAGGDIFSSAAQAQVSNEVGKVQRPAGFADVVERVKPSVISVRVNMREKPETSAD